MKRKQQHKISLGAAALLGSVVIAGNAHADGALPVASSAASALVGSAADTLTSAVVSSSADSANFTISSSLSSGEGETSGSTGGSSSNVATGSSAAASSSAAGSSAASSSSATSSASSKASSSAAGSSSSTSSSATFSSHASSSSAVKSSHVASQVHTASAPNPAAASSNRTVRNVSSMSNYQVRYVDTSYPADTRPYEFMDASNMGTVVYTGPVLDTIQNVAPITKLNIESQEDFIKSIAGRIQIMAGKNNLYASIIIAQAILESGYGKSNLCQNDFNIFNITGAYFGKYVNIGTYEYDEKGQAYNMEQSFRVYSNYEQSLTDYINLMLNGTTYNSKIYAGTWKTEAKTYEQAAQALQGVYATDPGYAQKLIEIIQEYHLDQYDNVEMSTKVGDGALMGANPITSAYATDSDFPAYNNVEYPGSSGYAYGNCTEYVYNRIFQLGGYISQHLGNGGEWGVNAAIQGYQTSSTPAVGTAVSFPPGVAGADMTYGHVAFVEKVYADGSILISEMNATAGFNKVDYRKIDAGSAALCTYILPK